MKPRRIHDRAEGPVRIDPDKAEVIHVIDLPPILAAKARNPLQTTLIQILKENTK